MIVSFKRQNWESLRTWPFGPGPGRRQTFGWNSYRWGTSSARPYWATRPSWTVWTPPTMIWSLPIPPSPVVNSWLPRNGYNFTYTIWLVQKPVVFRSLVSQWKLRKPFVYSVRTLPAEMHFIMSQTPVPIAYVPTINTAYSDKMDLWQRTWNMMNYVVQYAAVKTIMGYQMDPIVHKYVDPSKDRAFTTLCLNVLRIYCKQFLKCRSFL